MRFRVTGRNKQTGREVSYVVEAADGEAAQFAGEARGLDVDSVHQMDDDPLDLSLEPDEAWAHLCRIGRVAGLIIGLIAILSGFILGVVDYPSDADTIAGPLWCIAGILLLMLVKK